VADLTAGNTINASRALPRQRTFTREQVGYLMHLAYESGRTATYREGLAELHSVWEDRAERRRTYEGLVADRIAAYTAAAERINAKLGRPDGYRYDGGPVDWDTGLPADWNLDELVDQEAGGTPRWPAPRTRQGRAA